MNYSLTLKTKNPTRGNKEDAGIDIYVPLLTTEFYNKFILLNGISNKRCLDYDVYEGSNNILIYPFSRIKLPTGVHFNIPDNNMLMVLLKTSTPYNTGIISGARVIDLNYQGLFIASLINTSDNIARLSYGQKFIQLVLVPINLDRLLTLILHLKLLYPIKTSRGLNGFGSTGDR